MFKIGVKHLWKQLCPEGKENQPPPDEELFSAKQLILSPDESKVGINSSRRFNQFSCSDHKILHFTMCKCFHNLQEFYIRNIEEATLRPLTGETTFHLGPVLCPLV